MVSLSAGFPDVRLMAAVVPVPVTTVAVSIGVFASIPLTEIRSM
jgi:hypothetical protein